MALQKQIYRMSAQGGLDTKTDEKNVLPTNYLELENIVFSKTAAFTKRYGYSAFTKDILESASQISSGSAVATFKDELLRYSSSNLYSYSTSESKWVSKGGTNFALASAESIAVNGDRLVSPCHDTYNNISCYIYLRDAIVTDTIEYSIIDNVTGSVLGSGSCGSGSNPTVIANTGKFYLFYTVGSDLKYRTIDVATPSTLSSETTLFNSPYYAAQAIMSNIYVASANTTSGIGVKYITSIGTVSSTTTIVDATTYDRVAISAEGTNVRITYGKLAATNMKSVLYDSTLSSAVHAPVVVALSIAAAAIGTIEDPTSSSRSHVYVTSQTAPYKLKKFVVTSAGAITTDTTVLNQAALQSLPQVYNGKVYFAVCRISSVASVTPFRTYFIASEDGDFMCKYGIDSGTFLGPTLPRLVAEGDSLSFTGVEAAEIQNVVTTGNINVSTVVKKYTADFSTTNNYFDTTLGDNMHIAGGILKMYDGAAVVEHNFLQTPDAPQLVTQGNGALGAILPAGTYQYRLVYKWIDKWGQTHRSTPSLPLTYVVPGGVTAMPTIRLLTLAFTSKTDVELEVYRTEANGTVFYKKAANFADRIMNSKTVESVTFDDTTDDATLINGETLYTTGGVLENVAATSSSHITTYKARAFTICSDGYTLQYSKRRELGMPVEFSEELKISIDVAGGRAKALAVMDDHLIIFKERAIFALTGEGPNALGEQDDFREPYLVNSDVGCSEPSSVVATPEGLMFKSAKGIRILRRNFTEEYIGAGVERYNDLSITSATLVPDTSEVRFTTDSDVALVYDYYVRLWTTFTNIDAVDALIYDGNYTFLRSNGDLMTENKSVFTDDGDYISTKITSSWIQMAGIQGFQRFYELLVLGTYESAHTLTVQFAYNFDPTWTQTATVTADSSFADSYQFRFYPKIQKCQAFKFSITDSQSSTTGESLSLSNFAAEIGLKPTAVKLGSGRSFGAS